MLLVGVSQVQGGLFPVIGQMIKYLILQKVYKKNQHLITLSYGEQRSKGKWRRCRKNTVQQQS